MSILYGILLGLIQGVAEFLPISSSGHLALLENLLGAKGGADIAAMDDSAFFNIMLHLATLIAVVIAYWPDVRDMVTEFIAMVRGAAKREPLASGNIPARRLILMLIIGTLPLFLVLPFRHKIESLNAIPWFVGAALIVTGVLLFVADRMPQGGKTERDMTVWDAVFIGVAQGVATIPGLSRSGTTITAGMSRSLTREFAVKYSFLMSLLSVLGAVVLSLVDVIKDGVEEGIALPCVIGMVVAGVTGYFSIRLLQKLVAKGRFGGFAYYCWGVGALSIVLSLVLK